MYGQLIYNKRGKTTQCQKDSLFNKRCWENWGAHVKILNQNHFLIPYTKDSSKWIKDLNMRLDTIKLLEENKQNTL